ncbi:MAG: TIGR04190 family B12-binding domain/radical SAM domain protein [Chloroflexi bacterium]|nr:TIGR04190 family B12-binding domain/radical SAM domain protein [Chloroflexota bacterium]
MTLDLVLLHAPSVYDFRQKTILYGPVSDQIPSTPVFEMYPIGFTSIAAYLEQAGYRVRIANLAVRMLNDRHFDVESFIKKLEATLFGIDLHWLVHAHGSIEIARLVKKYHPQAKVIFGGLSSSFYYRDLMQYPEIDYVMRGDSTEEPLRRLLSYLKGGQAPETVPNLVWRDSQGSVRENPFSHIPTDLSPVMVGHFDNIIRSVFRHRDLASIVPFKDWRSYPITAVFTVRGCTENCVICGGSAAAFRNFYGRERPAFRPPQAILQDIKQVERFSGGPIFIIGDLRQPGEDYARELLGLLEQHRPKNQFMLEVFNPPPRDFLEQASRACPHFCLEISPESHDPAIRKASGRNYSTEDMERMIGDALDVGCARMDVFFMIGLSRQTPQSVLDNIDYCGHLLERFKGDKRLSLFVAPLSPFLDPGSLGREQPERHGYRPLFRTLEEHRQALLSPSWKYSLNYETKWLSRNEIVTASYEALLHLNRLKARYGIIGPEMAAAGERRYNAAREMATRIDEMVSRNGHDPALTDGLKAEIDAINASPVVERTQLELPMRRTGLRYVRAVWSWLTRF